MVKSVSLRALAALSVCDSSEAELQVRPHGIPRPTPSCRTLNPKNQLPLIFNFESAAPLCLHAQGLKLPHPRSVQLTEASRPDGPDVSMMLHRCISQARTVVIGAELRRDPSHPKVGHLRKTLLLSSSYHRGVTITRRTPNFGTPNVVNPHIEGCPMVRGGRRRSIPRSPRAHAMLATWNGFVGEDADHRA